jgi:hypothetical protein
MQTKKLFLCGLTLVALFWSTDLADRLTMAEFRQSRANSPLPFVLGGFNLTLNRLVAPIELTGHRTLMMVLSDECPYSKRSVAGVAELSKRLRLSDSDQLVVVLTKGDGLNNELKKAMTVGDRSMSFVHVVSQAAFAQSTGVSWTPEFLAVDHAGRIRIASERLNNEVIAQIVEFFAM